MDQSSAGHATTATALAAACVVIANFISVDFGDKTLPIEVVGALQTILTPIFSLVIKRFTRNPI